MKKHIALLLGGTELLAAAAMGLTAGADPTPTAPTQNGANLYICVDPAISANHHVTDQQRQSEFGPGVACLNRRPSLPRSETLATPI